MATLTTTLFQKLLKEAVMVTQELHDLEHKKLTARAFLAEAIANAYTDLARLDALEEVIKRDGGQTLRSTPMFVRQVVELVRRPNWTRAPKEMRRISFLTSTELTAELATIHNSPMELFALGVKQAAERFPEDFGTVENWDAAERRFTDLQTRQRDLFRRIEREPSLEDLTVDLQAPPDARNARVGFAITGGAVPPGDDAGQRLVAWLLDHDVKP
jgi:hypothetical protein